MGVEDFVHVWLTLGDELLELGDLANFLERKDLIFLVSINSKTCRVVSSVFQTRESIDEGLDDVFAVLLNQVVDVAEDTTVKEMVLLALGFLLARRPNQGDDFTTCLQ